MPSSSFSNIVTNFRSNVAEFSCFALQPLFEQWNLLKIAMSCIVSFTFSFFMLTAKCIPQRVPTQVGFLVLMMLTSLYFCYEGDASKQGKTGERGYRSTLRLIYFEAFTLMSMSLSTRTQPGFYLGSSNLFLASCLILGVIKNNFLVGVGVAVLCYMAMNKSSGSVSGKEQSRRGGGDDNGLREEYPQILSSPIPLIIHPSPSLSTLRRRPVNTESSTLRSTSYRNLEYLVVLKTPLPILLRHMSLMKTLNCLSLSETERSSLLRTGWDFTEALPHLRLLIFQSPESTVTRVTLLMGPDYLTNFS